MHMPNIAIQTLIASGISFGISILAALAIWIIGRWLIRLAVRLIDRALTSQHLDQTLVRYISSIVTVLLEIVLVIAILGFFGVQTTSLAALIAAAGVAIGVAWSGLLANFAAGVFLVILKPFKNGDFVTAGGVTGTVKEIGLFVTRIDTLDNVHNIIGNNKILGDTIENFSANPFRRVDLQAQLPLSASHQDAIRLLKTAISQIPNVLSDPAPDVEILEFNPIGPMLAVRPYCNNQHYWQVYFDTNRTIRETLVAAGFPPPEQYYVIRQSA
jgi:small conductance mechanosensitive channel